MIKFRKRPVMLAVTSKRYYFDQSRILGLCEFRPITVKLIICQISQEQSVTIHEMRTS